MKKQYTILNAILIIYILSLSVGYAFLSESLTIRGVASTVEFYSGDNLPHTAVLRDTSNNRYHTATSVPTGITYSQESWNENTYTLTYNKSIDMILNTENTMDFTISFSNASVLEYTEGLSDVLTNTLNSSVSISKTVVAPNEIVDVTFSVDTKSLSPYGDDTIKASISYMLQGKRRYFNFIINLIGPKYYTFTINPTPSNAKVTINGVNTNSVSVLEGTEVSWSVSLGGYETQSRKEVVTQNITKDIKLVGRPILAQGNSEGEGSTFLNGPLAKNKVETITFEDTVEIGEGSIGSWDASAAKDGSVIAWYTDLDGNNLYELTIGGDGGVVASSLRNLFYNFTVLKRIDFNNSFDTSNAKDMYYVFGHCRELTSLDLTNFVTTSVTNMAGMFYGCSGLTSLNLSNFNTQSVTSMNSMFRECGGLTSLDLTNFVTTSVTNMINMFYGCSGLTSLNLSNFNTQSVTNMTNMFRECGGLTSLDLTNFVTTSVTNMVNMFYGCSGLTSLNLSNFNTQSVTNMTAMFYGCSGLTSLNLSNFNTQSVTSMYYMFRECRGLTSLDLTNFVTTSVTNMSYMFYGCSGLTSLNLSNFNTQSVTNMVYMFYGCSGLTSLNLSNFNTQSVTNMTNMFRECGGLTSLDLTNFVTTSVTNMVNMFYGCSGLTSLNLSNFNTQSVTNMTAMFYGCSGLTSLNLSNFNTQSVTSMYYMFRECRGLTSLDLTNFVTTSVTNMAGMFYGCSGLTSLNLSNFNTQSVTNMSNMFYGCSGLTNLNIKNFAFGSIETYVLMFNHVPNSALITVKDQTAKDWVLARKSTFTNIVIATN